MIFFAPFTFLFGTTQNQILNTDFNNINITKLLLNLFIPLLITILGIIFTNKKFTKLKLKE